MFAAVYVTQYRLVALAHRTVAVITDRPQRAEERYGAGLSSKLGLVPGLVV